jgi:hypothetical protein
MKQNLNPNLNPNKTNPETKLNQIKQILIDYINDRIDSYKAADKIVDIVFPWYEHYVPLLSYNMDPWQTRARDVLDVEELLAICGDISEGEEEMLIECVVGYLTDH